MDNNIIDKPLKEKVDLFIKAMFGGEHHVMSIQEGTVGFDINLFHQHLATVDFGQLTKIVVLSHDLCIRVSLGSKRGHLTLFITNRKRSGTFSEFCPPLEEHINQIRENTVL